MAQSPVTEQRQEHPQESLLAKAICSFANGETRRLYLTSLSSKGAFILSLRPPSIRSTLSVTIYPQKLPPLPPLEARVIGLRIDPANAERSGFEVGFSYVNEEILDKLRTTITLLEKMNIKPLRPPRQAAHERRQEPRVPMDLSAVIHLPQHELQVQVVNLSMSGAMLGFRDQLRPPLLIPGAEISMSIVISSAPESIKLQAQIVRLTAEGEPVGVGVCFLEVSDLSARRIEGLILDEVVRSYAVPDKEEEKKS
jgi:hypothetical protein